MAAPKLKIHQLPVGYSEAGDTDIKQATADELLPFVDKSPLLEDAELLVGIAPAVLSKCIPVDLEAGRTTFDLVPPSGIEQTPDGVDLSDLVVGPSGDFEVEIYTFNDIPIESLEVNEASGWRIVYDDAGVAEAIEFVNMAPPMGAKINAWSQHSLPHDVFALSHDRVYQGGNDTFNKVVLYVDGGDPFPVTPSGENQAYVQLDTPANQVYASFWFRDRYVKHFCGEHQNWIGGHYNMWPNIFLGLKNYPGDSTIDPISQLPTDPGWVPNYQEPGSYQISYRDGLVIFPDEVDTEELDVGSRRQGDARASYAHLSGIKNVTGQVLDAIAGSSNTRFKADTEQMFTDSHGKRWVIRNDQYLPLNVYVDGELTSVPVNVPADELTIKTS